MIAQLISTKVGGLTIRILDEHYSPVWYREWHTGRGGNDYLHVLEEVTECLFYPDNFREFGPGTTCDEESLVVLVEYNSRTKLFYLHRDYYLYEIGIEIVDSLILLGLVDRSDQDPRKDLSEVGKNIANHIRNMIQGKCF